MPKKITLEIVEKNTKSRKGLYVKVKQKGKRAALYRFLEDRTKREYIQKYINRDKKGKRTPWRRKPVIEDNLTRGITEATITNALKTTRHGIHRAKMKALSPVIKDKEILSLLAMKENISKIRHRFEHRIEFYTGRKKTGEAKVFNKATDDVILDVIAANQERDYINWAETDDLIKRLQIRGYECKRLAPGRNKVTSVKVKIIFRKG